MGIKERKRLEKQMRKNQILDAARKLLFSEGIEKISINRISKEAELGVGTIYFYYKNKEDIFIALQQEGLSVLFNIVEQIGGLDLEPDEKLRKIAQAYYDFTQNQEEYFSIINYFLSSSKIFFDGEKKARVDMAGHKVLRLIQDVIREGMDAGFFMEKDPVKFSIMYWGTLHGLVQFKKLEQTTLANQDHREIYAYSVDKLIQSIVWE